MTNETDTNGDTDAPRTDDDCTVQDRLDDLKEEMRWYRSELLEMAEEGEQGSDLWEEYQQEHEELCKKQMRLARRSGGGRCGA